MASPVAILDGPDLLNSYAVGQTLEFSGVRSYDPDGTIRRFRVDFGDRYRVQGKGHPGSFSHAWSAAGTYTVKLVVTDNRNRNSAPDTRIYTIVEADDPPDDPPEIPADTVPDPFTVPDQAGVALSTVITSEAVTITGLGAAAAVSVSSGITWSKDGGAYTSADGTITNNQVLRLRVTSSSAYGTPTTGTVTIGGVSVTWTVTTLPVALDTAPDPFSFQSQLDVARSTAITSEAIIPTGFNTPVPISISTGEYSINGGAFTSSAGTLVPGQSVAVKVTSSASYLTTTTVRLQIGDTEGTFVVRTLIEPADTTPNPFGWPSVTGQIRSTVTTSATITITGLNASATLTISGGGGQYSKNGGAFTSSAGTIVNNDTLAVRVTSSASYGTTVTTTVTIGGTVTGSFSVTTGPTPPSGSLLAFPGAMGHARLTRHAYAGGVTPQILYVINRNDSGPGSLREAWMAQFPRIILPKVSGYVDLTSDIMPRYGFAFYGGQAAVSGGLSATQGLTMRYFGLNVTDLNGRRTSDIVVQHLRNIHGGSTNVGQNLTATGGVDRVLFDHCAANWTLDDALGAGVWSGGGPRDITFMNCLVMEPLQNASYWSTGVGTYGKSALTGGNWGSFLCERIDFIRCVSLHSQSRWPGASRGSVMTVDCLNYNMLSEDHGLMGGFSDHGRGTLHAAFVQNRYKSGPNNTGGSAGSRRMIAWYGDYNGWGSALPGSTLYKSGNVLDDATGGTVQEYVNFGSYNPLVTQPHADVSPTGAGVTLRSETGTAWVTATLAAMGAYPLHRDTLDARAATEIAARTGSYKNYGTNSYPSITASSITSWGDFPADPHGAHASGYTNLENWLYDKGLLA